MEFKFEEACKDDIETLVKQIVTRSEFSAGIESFEQLIAIDGEKSEFGINFGRTVNERGIYKLGYGQCFMVESFINKISLIVPELSLGDIEKPGFEEKYNTEDFIRLEGIRKLFAFYIRVCAANSEMISNAYRGELLDSKIDYVCFAKEQLNNLQKEQWYVNDCIESMAWVDDNATVLDCDFNGVIKFIGEAGLGKTTQMSILFKKLVSKVVVGEEKKLPIWITLRKLDENVKIEDKIKEELAEYAADYEMLANEGVLALFLDGFNEVIAYEGNDDQRKALATEIDDIYSKYINDRKGRRMFIAVSDRTERANPPYLSKKPAYTLRRFSKDDMVEYVELCAKLDKQQEYVEYIRNSAWLDGEIMIPAKMNSLISLLDNDKRPDSSMDFYGFYLEYMFWREADEKKETKIAKIKRCLRMLASEMSSATDEKMGDEITDLWTSIAGNWDEANRFLELCVQFPILGPGKSDYLDTYMFVYPDYFNYFDTNRKSSF